MHVSILTREYPPSVYGGAGVHVAQLVPRLREHVDVDVQCMGDPRDGATAHPESFPPGANAALRILGTDLAMVAALPSELDLVHSHTWYANMAGHLAGLFRSIPHVVTAHSLEPLRPWKREQLGGGYELSSWAERTAYEGASAVIAVSSAMAGDIARCYPDLDPAKLHVVRNGIDTQEFYPDSRHDFLDRIGIDLDRPMVCFVGRITRQKGLVHLVRAAREFDKGTQILLLASSPDTPEIAAEFSRSLDALRAEHGSDVFWIEKMAPRDAVRQVYSHATVFACPSIYEPLGIVNLEAMACESAVVASGVGGIPEVVDDSVTGLLVDYDPQYGDEQDYIADFEHRFAARVNELTRDTARAARYGQAGRQRCIDHFSWEAIAAQTVAVYQAAQQYFEQHRA
ncbi:starch synthase [Propionibacterium cyclohexanicum]|uniref:Starch synthase n=1 Tax=Propionibacterium cyclohexanicum TaxID=64702 RepID=A0A1H9PFT8_9ACTN|nr:glycogen synthase [Propionibacterium cyclohexanicum]SER47081.1 starch synthase [Propionibacterium cyclohexanicum]